MNNALSLKNEAFKLYIEFSALLIAKANLTLSENAHVLRNIEIDFSVKTKRALGICYPDKRKITLNLNYFLRYPDMLAYTVFHECIHQFLFDLKRPWHHTQEFYKFMSFFPVSRYPEDKKVYIHQRSYSAAKKERLIEDSISEVLAKVMEF